MATPIPSQGTTITHNNGTTAQAVGGHQSFSGLGGGEASEEDVSTLASTAKEKRLGLVDEGSFSIDALYDPSDIGQASMLAARTSGAVREMVITLSSGDIATFNSLIKSAPIDGSVDESVKCSYSISITGPITWT